MNPADRRIGQRVLHAGRAYVVSAIPGDRATITDGNEFRAVPIAELEPALQDGRLELAIRNLGKDVEPEPNWQQGVWQGIGAGAEPKPALLVAAGIIVLGAAIGVAVGLLIAWVA